MDNFDFVPTNTLASTSFDVLTTEGIDDPLINVNKLATMDLEESYFVLATEFVKEMNEELMKNKMVLYKSISEATGEFVVLESFSDFFSKASDIINKFIKFIKSLLDKFITALHKLVASDKYIIKHKKELRTFSSGDEFTFNGYEYTFSPSIPTANASLSFTTESLFQDIYNANGGNIITQQGITDVISTVDLESKYDDFRGQVLGKAEPISVGDYSMELFRIFRNDEIDTESIEVTSSVVNRSLDRFENYKKAKSQVESDQKRIEKDYENVKKNVRDITRNNAGLNKEAILKRFPTDIQNIETNKDGIITSDLMLALDRYTQMKIDQITEFSNIHTLAFSAKLDALKESYKQDRAMLYTALSKVQRTDAKRGV